MYIVFQIYVIVLAILGGASLIFWLLSYQEYVKHHIQRDLTFARFCLYTFLASPIWPIWGIALLVYIALKTIRGDKEWKASAGSKSA